MLYQAFYPSELSDHHPIPVSYRVVLEGKILNLVVVLSDDVLLGTPIKMLNDKTLKNLFCWLLDKHVFKVPAEFIKVSYLVEDHLKRFEGYTWSFNPNFDLVEEPMLEKDRVDFLLKELKK